jgi:hypothetical protein
MKGKQNSNRLTTSRKAMALESYMKTLIGPSSQVVIVDDNITTWLSLHGDDDKHETSSCHDSFRIISNDLTDKRSQVVIVDDNITTWLSLHGDDDKHEISSCNRDDSFRIISNDLTDKRSQIVDPTAMNASFSRTSYLLSPQSTTATHQHLHILETPPLPSLTVRRR